MALTFDDGPTSYTPLYLDILAQFLSGKIGVDKEQCDQIEGTPAMTDNTNPTDPKPLAEDELMAVTGGSSAADASQGCGAPLNAVDNVSQVCGTPLVP